MIFNVNNDNGKKLAISEFNKLIGFGGMIEIKSVSLTRTNQQNRALFLFFKMAADALNEIGHTYTYSDLEGETINIRWNEHLFKEFTWKPIQAVMFGTDSTTKLKRNEIDPILDSIFEMFGRLGIEINFPNQFDYYLKFYENQKKTK